MADHQRETGHHEFWSQDFDSAFNSAAANRLHLLLQQAIVASLNSLGGRSMNSIIWHLKNKGILIDSKNVNIKLFYQGLEETIGPAADTILEAIIKQLSMHYELNSGRKFVDLDSELHPVVKLQRLMHVILNLGEEI